MELNGEHHAPAALPLGKNAVTNFTGGWVDPRAGLNDSEGRKISD
jgi:hypothetical protein